MSWEIQGTVEGVNDVDALVASPTEAPAEHEQDQVDAVVDVVKSLVDADVVGGPFRIRAGGHANAPDVDDAGLAFEMVTLTIEVDRGEAPPEIVDKPGDVPTWGDARTTSPEDAAANAAAEAETAQTWGDAKTADPEPVETIAVDVSAPIDVPVVADAETPAADPEA